MRASAQGTEGRHINSLKRGPNRCPDTCTISGGRNMSGLGSGSARGENLHKIGARNKEGFRLSGGGVVAVVAVLVPLVAVVPVVVLLATVVAVVVVAIAVVPTLPPV